MVGVLNRVDVEEIARQAISERIKDWYDLISFGKPVFDASEPLRPTDTLVYVLKGYVDVEFKTGWLSSARERSRSGRVLFTVKLNAQSGKILSVKHRAEQE